MFGGHTVQFSPLWAVLKTHKFVDRHLNAQLQVNYQLALPLLPRGLHQHSAVGVVCLCAAGLILFVIVV